MPTLGARLRRSREHKGWTQTYVCRKLGLSNSTYSGWERDYREPDAEMLSTLAQLYDVTIDYLINGDKRPIDNLHNSRKSKPYIDKSSGHMGLGETYPFDEWRLVPVPIVAEISCGEPVLTEANIIGHFPVDTQFIRLAGDISEYVYMRAVGNSMVGANIRDGSMVLLRLQNTAENGDIAAVCIDNEKATLKRIYHGGETVTLVPENPTMQPMTYDANRVRIVAKAVQVTTQF